jgi:hypothetical protein
MSARIRTSNNNGLLAHNILGGSTSRRHMAATLVVLAETVPVARVMAPAPAVVPVRPFVPGFDDYLSPPSHLACRTVAWHDGVRSTGRRKFKCPACKVKFTGHLQAVPGRRGATRRSQNFALANRPCCWMCHRALHLKGKSTSGVPVLRCADCGVSFLSRESGGTTSIGDTQRRYDRPDRPECITCRKPMFYKAKASRSPESWGCRRCRFVIPTDRAPLMRSHRAAFERFTDGGAALLLFCRRAVPAHFVNRDDVANEIALRILTRQLLRSEVTPLLVRQIDRAILKSQSEYVNISLETPNRDGVRLEERLVG